MPAPLLKINALAREPAYCGGLRTAEVLIYGQIGENWFDETLTAKNFTRELAAIDADEIIVRINSVGGSVQDGIAIYNALIRHPARVVTINEGAAMSIASYILMAGNEIRAMANSLMMIHAPWTYADGNSKKLRDTADLLDKWSLAMCSGYRRSGQTDDEIMALLTDGQDHFYTAQEALEAGFADTVDEPAPADKINQTRAEILACYPGIPATCLKDITMKPILNGPQPAPASQAAPQPAPSPATAPQAAPQAAPQPAPAGILAADRARRDAVRAQFACVPAGFDLAALARQCEDDHHCTAETAAARILAAMAAGAVPAGSPRVETIEDETGKRRDAVAVALLARAGLASDEQRRAAQASPYRGQRLLDLARGALDRAHVRHNGMDQMQLVAAAFTQSTSDFPILLENTMHRALLAAYAAAPDTWRRFCATGSVSDFRAHNRYRVGSLGNLETVNELGEFKNKSIPDGEKAQISVGTKGYIINLSRQAVINDDLGAFVGLAAQLGRAAHRTIETDVYAVLTSNGGLGPLLADGKTLFHADHNNLGAAAALSVIAIDADRVVMASQTDAQGNEFLDLRPAVLLVPLALGGTARVINGAEYDPDTPNKLQRPNIVNGLFRDIVDTPRLSGTRRYLFAEPSEAPAIEVAFLDGQQEPYLEQQTGFTVDGTQYKVRLDFGIAGIDYRGAVTNAGA
jgi:ATP-dependent protease ClpP protease subunit